MEKGFFGKVIVYSSQKNVKKHSNSYLSSVGPTTLSQIFGLPKSDLASVPISWDLFAKSNYPNSQLGQGFSVRDFLPNPLGGFHLLISIEKWYLNQGQSAYFR